MVHTDTPTQNIILPTQNINKCNGNGNGHQQLILPSSYSWFVGLSSSPTILSTSSDDVDILHPSTLTNNKTTSSKKWWNNNIATSLACCLPISIHVGSSLILLLSSVWAIVRSGCWCCSTYFSYSILYNNQLSTSTWWQLYNITLNIQQSTMANQSNITK